MSDALLLFIISNYRFLYDNIYITYQSQVTSLGRHTSLVFSKCFSILFSNILFNLSIFIRSPQLYVLPFDVYLLGFFLSKIIRKIRVLTKTIRKTWYYPKSPVKIFFLQMPHITNNSFKNIFTFWFRNSKKSLRNFKN